MSMGHVAPKDSELLYLVQKFLASVPGFEATADSMREDMVRN
jgi:hypothetical protein